MLVHDFSQYFMYFCHDQSLRPIFQKVAMFDNYIINLNWFGKMVKKATHKVIRRLERTVLEEKESIFEDCQEQSTIPALDCLKKQELAAEEEAVGEEENIPPKSPGRSSPIRKERKRRSYNPDGRFLKEHRRRFFLFPLYYATRFPFCKISWEHWKPSGYFTRMAAFLSDLGNGIPNKTGDQCKSFDQRQKKEIYTEVDLFQAAFTELTEAKVDEYSLQVVGEYVRKMDNVSEYMGFLSADHPIFPLPVRSSNLEAPALPPSEPMPDLIFNEFFDSGAQEPHARVF